TSRSRLARINNNGSLDTSFDPGMGPNSDVMSVAVQSDNKIIIGGAFTAYDSEPSINRIARINSDGTRDSLFNVGNGASGLVRVVSLQGDKVLVGGSFTTIGGITRSRIARLEADGSID